MLVYPEGTIVPPGQTRPARPGAGLVALRASVPVLPIASRGLERRRRCLRPLRRRVTVVVGPAVDLSSWRGRLDRKAQLEASAALLASMQALRHNLEGTDGRLVAGVSPRCSRRRGSPAATALGPPSAAAVIAVQERTCGSDPSESAGGWGAVQEHRSAPDGPECPRRSWATGTRAPLQTGRWAFS